LLRLKVDTALVEIYEEFRALFTDDLVGILRIARFEAVRPRLPLKSH
jgi:hypothetical protein